MSHYSTRNYYGDVKEKGRKMITLRIHAINSNLMVHFKK